MLDKELLDIVSKYNQKDEYSYRIGDNFNKVCNAPKQDGGVYIVSSISDNRENVIYIGASGKMLQNGTFKVRDGGMRYRLINGTANDDHGVVVKRKKLWNKNMEKMKITEIKIRWWITFDEQNQNISTCVEGRLIQAFYDIYGKLPEWNKSY